MSLLDEKNPGSPSSDTFDRKSGSLALVRPYCFAHDHNTLRHMLDTFHIKRQHLVNTAQTPYSPAFDTGGNALFVGCWRSREGCGQLDGVSAL